MQRLWIFYCNIFWGFISSRHQFLPSSYLPKRVLVSIEYSTSSKSKQLRKLHQSFRPAQQMTQQLGNLHLASQPRKKWNRILRGFISFFQQTNFVP